MTISQSQSDFLNLSRWFAAWLVVAEHARSLMIQDYASLPQASLWAQGFYFLTGFGHEAVMFFFVVSGFLVGGKALEQVRASQFQWQKYLCDRLSRLYAVLVVALVLGWGLDFVAATYFDAFGLYRGNPDESVAVVVRDYSQGLGPAEFLGNLAFLQTIVVVPLGSNGPLWSLANEWWYYILFPLVALGLLGRGPSRFLSGVGALILVVWLPKEILILFGVWFFGVACSLFQRRLLPWWLSAIICGGALLAARMEILTTPHLDQFLIAGGFGLLLNSLVKMKWRFPFASISTRLADFSYTTYLLHTPLLCFVLSVMESIWRFGLRESFGWASVAMFVTVVGLVLGISWMLSRVTEAKTPIFRGWLYRLAKVEGRRDRSVREGAS